jgi:16S rRNA (cytidine1402-2'-O)-methyltransferase
MLGEFTVVIAGFDPSSATHSDSEIVELVTRYESGGVTRKEAIAMVAKELALPKRKVFDIMVAAK